MDSIDGDSLSTPAEHPEDVPQGETNVGKQPYRSYRYVATQQILQVVADNSRLDE